ncbi:MAG TPA: NlpC/P60 family protein [Kineosporiaceae bacterium]|nr:NlpC/P60 family protein [Kineosporiaceae bacterium]
MSNNRAAAVVGGAVAVFFTLVILIVVLLVAGGGQTPAVAGVGFGAGLSDKVPATYRSWVLQAGSLCPAFPAAVIAAQIEAESGWNPKAVSPVGAQGLSQFMPGTWAAWGQDVNGDGTADPFDPADAIMAQGRYDCDLARQVGGIKGDITQLALAAYNAGPGAVLSAGGIPPYPETQAYVARITQLAAGYAALPAAGPFADAEIAVAKNQLGIPYVWGGGSVAGPTGGGFDCSGLVLFAVFQGSHGRVTLPRTADEQIKAVQQIPLTALQPGDLVAFKYPGAATFHHIAIYLGQGMVIQAPQTGDVVKISPLNSWTGQIYQAGRIVVP